MLNKKGKVVIYLLLFFLLLRIGIVIIAGQKENEFADAHGYNGYAHAILKNSEWLTDPDFKGNYRPPVYPMFIAFIYAIFGINNFLAVYLFQAMISVLTCFYIYKFSKKIFDEKVALLALTWSGFYIFYLKYVRELLRETLVFLLIIAFFYYLYLFLNEEIKRARNFSLTNFLYFLLIHTDPKFLFFLPFFLTLFIVFQPSRQGIKQYLMFLGVTVLLMVPWNIRNYIAYDAFILINTRTIDLRKTEIRDPVMDGYIKYNLFNFGVINKVNISKDYPTDQERELIKRGFNPNNRSRDEIIAIKDDVYPASTFIGRKWDHFLQLWKPFDFARSYRPFPDARFNGIWSLRHNISSILCYGLLLPFVFLSIYYLVKQKNKAWIFLTVPLITNTLLHILYYGRNRYRVPFDSFIIILGVYGIYIFAKKILAVRKI